jgi:ubiquitin-protein ligase
VAKNGEICVNTLKRDWKEDLGIGHILLVRLAEALGVLRDDLALTYS